MANESRILYQGFIKKGMPKEDAFFAVLDHFNEQHWYDRNRYGEEIKRLSEEFMQLKARLSALETKGQTE
jgi:hypothetical protein